MIRSTSVTIDDAPVRCPVDRTVIVGQQITQQLGDQALLLEQDGRRPPRLHLLPDLGPDLVEVGEVGDDVLFRSAGGRRADDHAAGETVLVAELLDDAAQAGALFSGLDLPGDADMVHGRHEHEEAAGHGHVRGETRALGAERLLDDLDENFLPFFQQVFDANIGAIPLVAAIAAPLRTSITLLRAPFRRASPDRRQGLPRWPPSR